MSLSSLFISLPNMNKTKSANLISTAGPKNSNLAKILLSIISTYHRQGLVHTKNCLCLIQIHKTDFYTYIILDDTTHYMYILNSIRVYLTIYRQVLSKAKVIYVTRNPRDAVVSLFNHWRIMHGYQVLYNLFGEFRILCF